MKRYTTTIPGYPRIGAGRIYKKLLEQFWSGALPRDEFVAQIDALRAERLRTQAAAGLELVPCGDFSLYDHVLDTAVMLGCVPPRFGWSGGPVDLELYFALARGRDGIPPCELTKWFDTNYHYLVPELPPRFALTTNLALEAFHFAQRTVGAAAKPVLLGPYTFLKLARLSDAALAARLDELTPLYAQILGELAAADASLVQLDESALVSDVSREEWAAFARCYRDLTAAVPKLPVLIQTCYGDVAPWYDELCALPVAGLGLDLVRGRDGNLTAVRARGFPKEKILVAGIVDGRNVWRTDLQDAYALIRDLEQLVDPERIWLSASCSLLHLPETVTAESRLPATLKSGLCFARERLAELALLARVLREGEAAAQDAWEEAITARRAWLDDPARRRPEVQRRVAALGEADATRLPYAERFPLQRARLNLPLLPTTTIGSFPQTPELRRARANAGKDPAAYQATITATIEQVIRLQEAIGLDVLVHGEPERNDMVQFFAEQLAGFASTDAGWVQSYGSRCVRPPIIYGDVERRAPMTLEEARLAQSLTERPVKGMLTGPVTMVQWSFVREDVPRAQVADQIALAMRDEARDLEREAGLRVIQIDEPAFREGLPLRRADWPAYLAWAVRAFRLASAGVSPHVQIHTHMCYSEFGDIIEAIAALDADVLSIEDARSDGAMLRILRDFNYPQQIGPGVYDIHSPNVPTVAEIVAKLRATLQCLPPVQVWVNPDCGLKTRSYDEVVPALRNMVAAARQVRAELAAPATAQ